MKTVNDYFNDLKEKTGSDYASAKKLEISRTTISMVRSRGQMSDETAIKVADLLEIERTEVLIAAAIARSEGEVKKSWENISRLTGIAASVVMACILSGIPAEKANAEGLSEYTLCEVLLLIGLVIALELVFHPRRQKHGALLPRTQYFC